MASITSEQGLELLKSGELSDYTIQCEEKNFAVHRLVLCAKSKFFSKCIQGKFEEAHTSVLIIREANHVAVACFIAWLYTGEVKPSSAKLVWPHLNVPLISSLGTPKPENYPSTIVLAFQVHELSKRFMIPDLESQVVTYIVGLLEGALVTTRSNCPSALPKSLNTVFLRLDESDVVLRTEVLKWCVMHSDRLEKMKGVMEVIRQHELVTWDVAIAAKRERR